MVTKDFFVESHQTYTKINTLYKRDTRGNIMLGDFSRPEFSYLYHNKWRAFEKVDGTNMSFYCIIKYSKKDFFIKSATAFNT